MSAKVKGPTLRERIREYLKSVGGEATTPEVTRATQTSMLGSRRSVVYRTLEIMWMDGEVDKSHRVVRTRGFLADQAQRVAVWRLK